MNRVGVLLAAGRSLRFGAEDKLLATLQGRPLIAYAADAVRNADLERRIAVISNAELRPLLAGFDIVEIAAALQSDSLRASVIAAGNPDRLLVTLGDMPLVTSQHLDSVVARCPDDMASASVENGQPMPPACFSSTWLRRLSALMGDRGAGSLLRDLPQELLIPAPGLLTDIDTPSDLLRL